MADQNKTVIPEITEGEIIDFGRICRFCLSETKNNVSINDKCLRQELEGSPQESIYNFVTEFSFIKMNNSDSFPLQVCEKCFKIVQLCHDFSQICQKSDNILKRFYENSLKEEETKNKISDKETFSQELLHHGDEKLPKEKNSFTALSDIDKIKKSCSEPKLKDSLAILDTHKQKLAFLSERIKEAQTKLANFSSGEELNLAREGGPSAHGCSQCSLKFASSKALDFHCAATHSQKRFRIWFRFQCRICLKSFSTQEKARRHYVVIHNTSQSSDDCLNTKEQQTTQTDKRKFSCFHCVPYKAFLSRDQLTQHLENFHPPKKEPSEVASKFYSCAHCSCSNFQTKLSLNQHLSSAHDLREDEITWKDFTIVQTPKHSKVILCVKPTALRQDEKQPLNLTELSAFLGVLSSVVGSLNLIQKESGFKIVCRHCGPKEEFASVYDFVRHTQNGHGETKLRDGWPLDSKPTKEGPWSCSECPASYSSKQSLRCHLKEKHKRVNVGGMKCPDCQENFATNRQLIQHGISVHQKYFAYFHNVYRKILQPEAEDEEEEEEENKVRKFECDLCQKRYFYKTSLKKHILGAHLGRSTRQSVVCSYCGKTVSSKLNLKSHIEFVHKALFVYCPVCRKKINFMTIGKHYKTHRNSALVNPKDSFLCNLCGKILKSKRSFEDHQKIHKNIRDELCDVCGSGFTNKKCLRIHKKTHEGVRRKVFGCDQCEKVFSGRHTLNRHLLTHSGKKNFVCEMCSKSFYTIQELNRHVRGHKKEYRFDCQLCDMRFLDKSRFRHHMMIHRNVRPHKCHLCEKMFTLRAKLNVHMTTKHNVEGSSKKAVWKDPETYVPLDALL